MAENALITNPKIRQIPLSRGKFAIVDASDYDWLNQWKWSYRPNGYAIRKENVITDDGKLKRKTIRMHRIITNAPDNMEVDHINRNGLDNRRGNLRIVTHAQNMCNQKVRTGTSKYKGVIWYNKNNKWLARIRKNGKAIHLGYFVCEIEAALAYNAAALKYHGEFARLNEIVNVV